MADLVIDDIALRYGDHEIWGLTGRMLKAFLDLVWQAV